MDRQPTDLIHVNLRLREDLRQQLETAAKQKNTTLSNEIRWRLEDSFQRETVRGFEDILYDMQVVWARFGARYMRLDLEKELAEQLMHATDLPKVKTLAREWLRAGAIEQRQLKGGV
jgi:hypothetical protein